MVREGLYQVQRLPVTPLMMREKYAPQDPRTLEPWALSLQLTTGLLVKGLRVTIFAAYSARLFGRRCFWLVLSSLLNWACLRASRTFCASALLKSHMFFWYGV